MSIEELISAIEKQIPKEMIDGDDVREVAERCVDLSCAYTPVIPRATADPASNYVQIPEPIGVIKERGSNRYAVVYPKSGDFSWVSEKEIAVMRARYLLLRGFYNKVFDSLAYSDQQRILCWYFPQGRLDVNKLLKGPQ